MNMMSATVRDPSTGTRENAAEVQVAPRLPMTLEQTGLSESFVSELLMKTLYVQGSRTGDQLAAFSPALLRVSWTTCFSRFSSDD